MNVNKYFKGVSNGKACIACDQIFPVDESKTVLENHIENCKGWEDYFDDKPNKPTKEIPWMKYDKNTDIYFKGVSNGKACIACDQVFPVDESETVLENHIENCEGWDNYFDDKPNKPTKEIPWMKYDKDTDIWACECGQWFDNIQPEFDAKTEAFKHQKRHAFLRMMTMFKENVKDPEDFK